MSATAVSDVLDRSMADEAFLDRFRAHPDRVLEGYDLSDEEAAALRAGDESHVREVLGTDDWNISVVVVVIG